MFLSVIVPAYNEETNLKNNIYKFNSYLTKQNFDYEIIIIDDGSEDKTNNIARKLSQKLSKIKLITKTNNQGKGAAIRDGLLAGKGDFLLFLDADNATPINHLEKVWPLSKKYDLIIGSRNQRDISGAKQAIKQNPIKRLFGIVGNKIIKLFTGIKINDTQCGFKIFNRQSVDIIIPKTKINRWTIDVEILTIAKKHNLKIGIIPVIWYCGPNSRVTLKGYFNSLKELLIIKLNDWQGKYN